MNQQERDEVRKKHTLEPYEDRITGQEVATCAHCCTDEWPCDVIKVLDAWQAEVHHDSEVSVIREVCDHADWTSNVYSDDIYADMGYRYCPKCGEKL